MKMCDFELNVLSKIAFGNFPDDPGAAWFAACEVLANRGFIKNGKTTDKGLKELIR